MTPMVSRTSRTSDKAPTPGGKLLLATQAYVPDTAAVGQYMADAAAALASRGWRVTVVTSRRGYNDPGWRFPPRDSGRDGVRIRRVWGLGSGKRSLHERLSGMIVFTALATVHAWFMPGLSGIIVTTSPPILPVLLMAVARLRRVPLIYWVMDLNPDQVIESGQMSANAWSARGLALAQRWVFAHAATVVVLDRFMEARVKRHQGSRAAAVVTCPLWPLATPSPGNPDAARRFRERHGLDGHFVVMYSGNHSRVHPLDTVVAAARLLKGDKRFRFVFIGGGEARAEMEDTVERESLAQVVLLPSQPLETLGAVLSAADLHLVSMGDRMVGCVHPSKVYGVLGVGRPFVFLGPSPCHVTDLFVRHDCGWRVAHGAAADFVQLLLRLASPEGRRELEGKRIEASQVYAGAAAAGRARLSWVELVEDAVQRNRS